MGESACLGSGLANVRVARLSNVFGRDLASENFLTAVLREAVTEKRVSLRTALAFREGLRLGRGRRARAGGHRRARQPTRSPTSRSGATSRTARSWMR